MALIFLFSCTKKEPVHSDEAVVVVNKVKLSTAQFAQALARKLKIFDALAVKDPDNISRATEKIIQDFVVSTLLTQFAQSHGVTVTPQEVLDEMDRVRKSYPDDLTFKASLATDGQSLEDWKNRIGQSLLEKKAVAAMGGANLTTSTDEPLARKYYSDHKEEYNKTAQIHLFQIVVSKEEDALQILQKLKSGFAFEVLAKKFSVSPDARKGGDVGYISKGVVPAFDAAFNLPIGKISGIIKSSYGFHIMKILDKKKPTISPFEHEKNRIIGALRASRQQEAFSKWLADAVKVAKIERNDMVLDQIKVKTVGISD